MNKIIEYIIGRISGYHPICDRCLDVEKYSRPISFLEYLRNRKGDCVYCRMCWNWMRLKKGKCGRCGNSFSQRSEEEKTTKKCGCGNMVELESP